MNPAGAFVYITAMSRLPLVLLCLAAASASALAQDTTPLGSCAVPDSIAVRGNDHVDEATIRGDAGLVAGANLNYRDIQRAIRSVFATGQFDDVKVTCSPAEGAGTRTVVLITVKERPVLSDVRVEGADRVSKKSVRDRIEIPEARPLNPALVSRAVERIDSLYESHGYYLARVKPETTFVGPQIRLTFNIDEGRRLAVSGVRINGNSKISDADIVKAMKTKPEGFLWFRKGAFDEDNFAGDLGDRIPALYGKRGYIDFQVVRDTMIVDRENGKALVEITVNEGPQYRVGNFLVEGNKRFSTEEVNRFYPFNDYSRSITSVVTGAITGNDPTPKGVFDKSRWDDAFNNIRTAYSNEGYIYADLRPVVERRASADTSQHVVDLRWVIDEKAPAIINRIEIVGNDYTVESCIRDQLVIIPGDVYNQARLIRSWQSIGNLGFFETPVTPPDTRPANEQGDVDIIFNVKEKRTGNVNFGASVGQGLGVGGFIGLDQPNLFGRCKRGSLQWQFGRYVNDFNLSYSDPSIRQSRLSGTVSAYRSQARYTVADLGRSLRTGGTVELGFPVPRSPLSRLRFSYGAEVVSFGSSGLLGEQSSIYGNSSFRSTFGATAMHDTRVDMPFATEGGMQSITAQFSGGPLGGTYNFQQYRAETRAYAPLGQIGGKAAGSQPMKFVLGLTSHAGVVTGNTGPFFFSQEFALGGVQYGEQLRGYDEFSISPNGYVLGTDNFNATRSSFGKAFFTGTAELGLRVNQSLYANLFYDVGNVYSTARQFDPTRLFRGAGIGVSTVTPLGPLGLDYGYGFDRLDKLGRPAPKWQLHFRLGQLF